MKTEFNVISKTLLRKAITYSLFWNSNYGANPKKAKIILPENLKSMSNSKSNCYELPFPPKLNKQ